jgi:hypothetical protein
MKHANAGKMSALALTLISGNLTASGCMLSCGALAIADIKT